MADLIVHLCRCAGNDGWALARVNKSFFLRPKARSHPLLDDAEFAMRVVHGLADIPPERRRLNPVKYSAISPRLQASPEVALAFVGVYGCILHEEGDAPRSLSRAWKAAYPTDPLPTYLESFLTRPRVAKELVIALLKSAKTSDKPDTCLDELAKIFPTLPSKVRRDREICAQMVLSCALSPWSSPSHLFAP
jgi:hypothetical protein